MTADFYIGHLQLEPHPEGGFFRQTYRSEDVVIASALPAGFSGDRCFSTSIYYLLQKGDFSAFHRIKSDELWHFYDGGRLIIHMIEPGGKYSSTVLGNKIDRHEHFQHMVPAGTWFAVEPGHDADFALTGCTVSPGFDFRDFEMAESENLSLLFPQHTDLVKRLSRS